MKFLFAFIVILNFSPAFAKETPQCSSFKQNVLLKAVSENPKENESFQWKFVKDEKKALAFIKAFDAKKIEIKENFDKTKIEVETCKDGAPEKDYLYCSSLFESFNFIRALVFGVKENNWSNSTKNSALSAVKSFLEELSAVEGPALYNLLAVNILVDLWEQEQLSEGEAVIKLQQEIEKDGKKLQEANKEGKNTCADQKKMYERETAFTKTYSKQIKELIQKTKFSVK
jgi:hypothetical protein